MGEDLTLNVKFTRAHAALLLGILNERFEALQRSENHEGSETQEKDAISAIIAALDAATRQRTSNLSSLTAAEDEAREALAQAVENLAHAHVVFETSLASKQEAQSFAASAAIGVEESKVQRTQATYDTAAGRTLEAKAESAETNRRIAYAQSERAHDEALLALRRYEPLALEMLKLFSILTMHADRAMADVEAADKARISPHAAKAVHHLKTVIEEHRRGHAEAVMRNVLMALGELELAAG